jgi:hypothetical protein
MCKPLRFLRFRKWTRRLATAWPIGRPVDEAGPLPPKGADTGVKMGRKPKLTPYQQREAMKRRDNGEPVREIARSFNVHHATISRMGAGGWVMWW